MIARDQLSLGFVQQLCVRLKEGILKHDHECSTGRQNSAYFTYLTVKVKLQFYLNN